MTVVFFHAILLLSTGRQKQKQPSGQPGMAASDTERNYDNEQEERTEYPEHHECSDPRLPLPLRLLLRRVRLYVPLRLRPLRQRLVRILQKVLRSLRTDLQPLCPPLRKPEGSAHLCVSGSFWNTAMWTGKSAVCWACAAVRSSVPTEMRQPVPRVMPTSPPPRKWLRPSAGFTGPTDVMKSASSIPIPMDIPPFPMQTAVLHGSFSA